ncbi:hypothetical protein TIFTF001_037400 [Ficus carica]|uniref:Uncharacterized protein n=1 Tax=Ficus carica TaxID=3494 RepID=A0AA88EGZ6_FICCA|nr:hypothetical protein TIFTF001_037400 [Ficus carica]
MIAMMTDEEMTKIEVSIIVTRMMNPLVRSRLSLEDPILKETLVDLKITTMSSFLVIKGKSPYNTVIGRPTLKALKVVTLIYHQTMKFPTARGTEQVKGNQYESRTTYVDVVHDYAKARLSKTLRPENRMVLTKSLDIDLDRRLNNDKLGTGPIEDLKELCSQTYPHRYCAREHPTCTPEPLLSRLKQCLLLLHLSLSLSLSLCLVKKGSTMLAHKYRPHLY